LGDSHSSVTPWARWKSYSEAQLRGVVAVERDHQRAFAAQFDRHARFPFELGGEIGPQRQAGAVERGEIELARLGLHPRRQHAAAAQLAPCPASPRSNTSTGTPAWARRQPMPRPIAPPPMMATGG
jgi:hypothetical protein